MAEISVDITTFDEWGEGAWAQARYLAHGYDDVLWTDNLDDALRFIRRDLVREVQGEFDG